MRPDGRNVPTSLTAMEKTLRRGMRSLAVLLGASGLVLSILKPDLAFLAGASGSADPDWRALYQQLSRHFSEGLLLVSGLLIVIDLLFTTWTSIVHKMLDAKQRTFLIGLAFIVVATRVGWILLSGAHPWSDAQWYYDRAVGLANGSGYVNERGEPTAYWPPGYPVFLSILFRLFGSNILVGQIANAALSFLQVLLAYLTSRSIFPERAARVSALLLSVSVGNIAYAGLLMSEVCVGALLTLLLWYVVRRGVVSLRVSDLFILGIIIGIATLVRPVMLVVPAAILLTMLRSGMRWQRLSMTTAFLVIAIGITLLPNISRNYALFDSFVPVSTNSGINMWIGNNPDATGSYMPPPPLPLSGNEAQQSQTAFRAGVDWIVSNPAGAIVTSVKKIFHLFYRDDQGILFNLVRNYGSLLWPVSFALILIANLFYYCVFGGAVWGIWAMRRTLTPEMRYLVLVALAITMFYVVYFGADRFHFPLWPIATSFAGARIVQWGSASSSDSGKRI